MVVSITEANFRQTVLDADQPVLVNFWAPWCTLCHMLHPFLVNLQREWQGQCLVVDVNADDNFRLVNTYRLKTLPTVILFHKGEIVERIDQFQQRDRLNAQLKELLQGVIISN